MFFIFFVFYFSNTCIFSLDIDYLRFLGSDMVVY